jgi:hypothetical protein
MIPGLKIRAMDRDFILYRCLHGGPLTPDSIGQLNSTDNPQWWADMQSQSRFELNRRFLLRVIETYGSCAVLAWDENRVVGQMRFFPGALLDSFGIESMCMQQGHPCGVSPEIIQAEWPALKEARRKPLFVNCMMTGSPCQPENPYQRRGLASEMVRELVRWARETRWPAIEAHAFSDLPAIYEITGQAGRLFWEKLGFSTVSQKRNPLVMGDFLQLLVRQAAERGMPAVEAGTEYRMRLSLTA